VTATGNGGTLSGSSVGDVITIYEDGTNRTCYIEPKTVCIDAQSMTVTLDAWRTASDSKYSTSDAQITCYDNTGAAACSTGTNTSEEDWDITLGASQIDSFYLKLAENAANRAIRLGGIAMYDDGQIEKCYPKDGQGFTSVAVPTFLSGATLYLSNGTVTGLGTANQTRSGWEKLYKLSTPVLLNQWDSMKYQFIIDATTTDPATRLSMEGAGTSDVCGFVFLDTAYALDSNSVPQMDFYQHDIAEANIGINENVSMPVGGDFSGTIEGI
jgi:hypothetical protein